MNLLKAIVCSLVILFVQEAYAQANPYGNALIADACKGDEYLLELFCVGQVPVNEDNNHKLKILINHGYAVGYCEERRNPIWGLYKASKLARGQTARYDRSNFFVRDLRTSVKVSGETFGGGFDRGHMVPNAVIGNQYGTLAQMETFMMSNMCPQHKNLNQNAWADLEKWVSELAEERKHIFVFVGPIFGSNPPTIPRVSSRKIKIPDAFYMILVDTDKEWELDSETGKLPRINVIAYKFGQATPENADFKDRDKFGTSVDEIEKLTKLNFFATAEKLGPELFKKIEATTVKTHWSLD